MLLIGIGSNLPSRYGDSRATVRAAITALNDIACVTARSSLWQTAPVPVSDQAWYINAVVAVETDLSPSALLQCLHDIEAAFGRERHAVNAARPLDLDIIDYNGLISPPGEMPLLPHPRLANRAFVLLPLAEIAPAWRHPVSGASLEEMITHLPSDQAVMKLGTTP